MCCFRCHEIFNQPWLDLSEDGKYHNPRTRKSNVHAKEGASFAWISRNVSAPDVQCKFLQPFEEDELGWP